MNSIKYIAGLVWLFFGFQSTAQNTPKTLLWRIENPSGGKPSYIYGTMHTNDDRAFRLMDSVIIALETSDNFAEEVNLDSLNPLDLLSEVQMSGDTTLETLLNPKDYQLLDSIVTKSLGTGLGLMEKIKPIFLAVLAEQGSDAENKDAFLDLHLYNLAKQENKPVYGLERIEDQLKLLNTIPLKKQAKMLVEALQEGDNSKNNELDELIKYYNARDLDGLYKYSQTDTMDFENFSQDFVTKRNYVMASGIQHIMKTGTVFVAVGALHLAGTEGIINILKKRGYNVQPVLSKKILDPKEVKAMVKDDGK